jgi:hypothetical protein
MFGRCAALIPSSQSPVHIIMERSTGKTLCCFAEFESCQSARAAVDHVNSASDSQIGPRMGNRHVDVSMSSQEELMKTLFPMAKCLSWVDDRFVPHGTGPDEWWSSGFDGFLTDEELFCLTRHAREPHRVCDSTPFSSLIYPNTDEYLRVRLLVRYPSGVTNRSTASSGRQVIALYIPLSLLLLGHC